jgi:hypothetical protein
MRPTLPRIPRSAVNMLSVEWITKLINCLKYAMDYPKGDGKTTYRNGETISALRQPGSAPGSAAADTCNGYFKVIKDGETYSVVDGANPDAANCGYVNIGNERKAVPKVSGIEASGTGAFYIETTYTTSYQVSIEFAETLPAAANGTDIKLIADLDGGIPIQRLRDEHTIVRWV